MHLSHDFTPAAYTDLIQQFKDAGYSFIKFTDTPSSAPYVYWRHDVDISLDAAYQIAALEHEMNIHATYFVLLRSPLYNLFSARAGEILNQVIAWGHDIALHIDLSLYGADVSGAVMQEIALLQQFYPQANTQIVSFHRPGVMGKSIYEVQLPIRHTYEAPFFKAIQYISDSKGRWHYGHPLESAAFQAKQPMQVLTHPIWWVHPGANPIEKLRDFVATVPDRTIE
jgi:hypothetical protein